MIRGPLRALSLPAALLLLSAMGCTSSNWCATSTTATTLLALNYQSPVQYTAGTPIPNNLPNPTGGTPTAYVITSGSLPAGLTMDPVTGVITGTPTTPGVSTLTIQASNKGPAVTQTLTLTVVSATPMALSYPTPQVFPVGNAISTQSATILQATPGIPTTFALNAGTMPDGLSLNTTDGTISGTPTTPGGITTFSIQATNGTRSATASLDYTVTPAGNLALNYSTPMVFTAGTAIPSQTASLSNPTPGIPTAFGVLSGSLPAGLALNPDGSITGTPTVPGVYTFTIQAVNGTRNASIVLSYTVTPAAALSLSYPTPQEFTEGSAIPVQSPTVANETPGVPTSYSLTGGSLPGGINLNANGTIDGTPTAPGVYTFTITATNGTRSASASATYTVVPAAPLTLSYASPQTFTLGTAIPTQTPVIANETPGVSTTFAITAGSLPTGLALNADGTITGTPTITGIYTFAVTATNGSRTATASLTWTVSAAPTGLSYATPVTYTSGIPIPANNPNPSGGTPTSYGVSSGSLPSGLTLDPSTGVISGTPTAQGSFTVTITASNTYGGVSQTIQITVLPPLTASFSANPGTIPVGQGSSLTPIFSGGTGTVNLGIGTVASGGGYPTGVFTAPVTNTYILTVTNSAGASITRSATVTAVPVSSSNSITIDVPTTGVTAGVTNPSSPLNGLNVVVPNQGNAVCANTQLTITREVGLPLPGPVGGGGVALSDPYTFSTTVGYPFRLPFTVTLAYDGSSMGPGDVPVPFFWDPAYGQWIATGVKAVDTTNHLVTFTTLLPGEYAVLGIPGLAASLTTRDLGFSSLTDGWFQPNQGIFDAPGGSSLGMSSFSSWYFSFKKAGNGNAGLYSLLRQGDPNSQADDVSAHALISRLGNATNESWNQIWSQGAYQLTDVQTGLALISALQISGQPQIFIMGEARPAVNSAEATAIYKYDAVAKRFSVLDPNYPGMPLTIAWDPSTGAFTNYDRASGYIPTFTAYAIEGQPSIHRLEDYERAFNGAQTDFPNPPFATITVTQVGDSSPALVGNLATVSSPSNVTISGTVSNGSDNATYIYWSQNGGARTPVALNAGTFTFQVPALSDPYGTEIALETTADPCDPTFSNTGYTEFTVKQSGLTSWFPNICFESGAIAPWALEQGSNSGVNYPSPASFSTTTGDLNSYAITWTAGSIDSTLVTVGNDPNVPSIPKVFDGADAFQVNNPASGSHISRVFQTITVPTTVSVPKLVFYWAAVMQDPGHIPAQQPYVDILVEDASNSYQVLYYKHFYANDPSYPGWIAGSGQWRGINWQKVSFTNLSAYKGHNLKITVTGSDCTLGGHGGYAYLDGVNCN